MIQRLRFRDRRFMTGITMLSVVLASLASQQLEAESHQATSGRLLGNRKRQNA